MSTRIIKAKDCDCEFEVYIDYYYKNHTDLLEENAIFYKDAKLVRTCNFHEREARNDCLKKIKRNEVNRFFIKFGSLLRDLTSEIKIARFENARLSGYRNEY
jgi:hypothetical protein